MAPRIQQIDTTIQIVTPENISFQYEVAGPFRRLPAFLIDLSLRAAVIFGLAIGIAMLAVFEELLVAIILISWFLVEWFYGALLETYWNGQTIGKRMMGIRVLRYDGQPINGLQGVMRNVLRAADLMPIVPPPSFVELETTMFLIPTGLIAIVVPIFNRRYQRLGDLVSGTIVVVEERTWRPSSDQLDDPRIPQLAALIPMSLRISGKTNRAVSAFVEKRKYLSPGRRHEIAKHIAAPLLERCGLPPNTSYDLFMCALYHRIFLSANFEQADVPPSDLLDAEQFSAQPT
ncbi:MAG: RDD family protein [Planctomycetales bacterium]|nr:RDD family protein [Planctomycetales bacterium]